MRSTLLRRLGTHIHTLLLVAVGFVPWLAHSAPTAPSLERYQAARAALKAGQMSRYRTLAATLEDYILQPYLQFAYLKSTLKTATSSEIDRFLQRNPQLPIAADLRKAWLLELARRKQWRTFLSIRTTGHEGTRVACARVEALEAMGQSRQATALAKQLWLVGYSQPNRCTSAFKLLLNHGQWPPGLVLQRLRLALETGNPGLAHYLVSLLPKPEQPLAHHWLKVYDSPDLLQSVDLSLLGGRHDRAQVVSASLLHFARTHPKDAHALWETLEPRLTNLLTLQERQHITRTIGIFAAIIGLPQGERWLAALPAAAVTVSSRAWRARAALRNGDWPGLLAAVRAMPPWQREQDVWRYWEARTLLMTGKIASGRKLAEQLSGEFSYYGFLAADLVQRPYAKGPQPEPPDPMLQQKVSAMYLAQVALALHQADQTRYAGEAWRELIRRISPAQRLAAARLAQRQGWSYGAYTAAAQAGAYGDSALTFPLAHWQAVRTAAHGNDLSPALVLAMMRQESAFQSTVCSSAGACGLMQLMPSTACWIGKRIDLGTRFCNRKRLGEPSVSIRAGSAYLAYLMSLFANDIVAAVAAYNAGPGNVSAWLAKPTLRADTARWIATLPFDETRRYIQAVLFNRVVYAQRGAWSTKSIAHGLRLSDLLGSLSRLAASH